MWLKEIVTINTKIIMFNIIKDFLTNKIKLGTRILFNPCKIILLLKKYLTIVMMSSCYTFMFMDF